MCVCVCVCVRARVCWMVNDPGVFFSNLVFFGFPLILSLTFYSMTDSVGPVKPDDAPENLWGKDIPEPKEAFEANGFLMRRVRLTRPRRAAAGEAK